MQARRTPIHWCVRDMGRCHRHMNRDSRPIDLLPLRYQVHQRSSSQPCGMALYQHGWYYAIPYGWKNRKENGVGKAVLFRLWYSDIDSNGDGRDKLKRPVSLYEEELEVPIRENLKNEEGHQKQIRALGASVY